MGRIVRLLTEKGGNFCIVGNRTTLMRKATGILEIVYFGCSLQRHTIIIFLSWVTHPDLEISLHWKSAYS
jgi:hypothetical protein